LNSLMTSTESLSHEPLPDSTRTGTEVDLLASALHNALQGVTPPRHSDPGHKHPSIEIIVDSDTLILRGTGAEVSPALLSGRVVLHLTESTPVKQITLQFRGKAKLPPIANDPVSFSNSAMTYTLCNHEWSFLEGEKKHSHTLKAGRHLFPFQLHVGGSLPSTLYTDAYGGASVAYKLRAIATRPGFAHNLHTQQVITLLRSFGPEAFEYQQSLEIENTWPEKLMYSIMIPHKACHQLAKGVRVLSATSARASRQESTKALIEVYVMHQDQDRDQDHSPRTRSRAHSGPTAPGTSTPLQGTDHPQRSSPSPGHATIFTPASSSSASGGSLLPHSLGASTHSVPVAVDVELSEETSQQDLRFPFRLSQRQHILWSPSQRHTVYAGTSLLQILMDTHQNCAVLYRSTYSTVVFLTKAISATAATRQLLLGGPEVPDEQDPDTVLPSYPSHIRDRVANVYLPDQAALRVTNPPVHHETDHDGRLSSPTSGTHTPLEAYYVPSSLGGHGDPELEYVNSELLLSLSQSAPPPVVESPSSRPGSSRASRAPSRTHSPSPDREREREPRSRRSSGGNGVELGASTFVHESNSASRNLHGVFHVTMKPLTTLSSSFAIPTRHHPHAHAHLNHHHHHHTHTHPHSPLHQPLQHLQPRQHSSSSLPRTVPVTSHSLLHRAFTEVPDYGISSRGFLGGGVTPLETLQGLPSYEEAEMQRSRSDSRLGRLAMTGPPSPSSTLPLS
ncbi:hypothetical protein H4582DRAFT_1929108, partial [Lactarius indigo]